MTEDVPMQPSDPPTDEAPAPPPEGPPPATPDGAPGEDAFLAFFDVLVDGSKRPAEEPAAAGEPSPPEAGAAPGRPQWRPPWADWEVPAPAAPAVDRAGSVGGGEGSTEGSLGPKPSGQATAEPPAPDGLLDAEVALEAAGVTLAAEPWTPVEPLSEPGPAEESRPDDAGAAADEWTDGLVEAPVASQTAGVDLGPSAGTTSVEPGDVELDDDPDIDDPDVDDPNVDDDEDDVEDDESTDVESDLWGASDDDPQTPAEAPAVAAYDDDDDGGGGPPTAAWGVPEVADDWPRPPGSVSGSVDSEADDFWAAADTPLRTGTTSGSGSGIWAPEETSPAGVTGSDRSERTSGAPDADTDKALADLWDVGGLQPGAHGEMWERDGWRNPPEPEPPQRGLAGVAGRWSRMKRGERVNVVLYALTGVSVVAMSLELLAGPDSSPTDVTTAQRPPAAQTVTTLRSTTTMTFTLPSTVPAEPAPVVSTPVSRTPVTPAPVVEDPTPIDPEPDPPATEPPTSPPPTAPPTTPRTTPPNTTPTTFPDQPFPTPVPPIPPVFP